MKIKNSLLSFYIIGTILLLYCCNSVNNNVNTKTINFSHANQQFTLVPFYKGMSTYINKAKQNKSQIGRVYKSYVYNPIWFDFASKGECSFLAKNIQNPILDLETLDTEIEMLSTSGVEEVIKDALLTVSKSLPGPNTTVYIQVMDPSYKKMIPSYYKEVMDMGIHADTYGTGKILISIDPLAKNWKNLLPRIVAHEYHHSIWISRNFETIHFSLLDCLILEGRAEGFADLIYPTIEAPWPQFIELEKEHRVWKYMKSALQTRDDQMIMKMITGDNEIPFLSVYTMGYEIMQEFFKNNPDVPLLEWTDMKPEEFLFKSRYEDKYN